MKNNNIYEKKIVFTEEMQKKFFKLSRDSNPIHLDTNYSKVFFDNKKVVYGMMILLKCLSILKKIEKSKIKSIKVNYYNPLYVNENAFMELKKNNFEYTILIKVKEIVKIQIILNLKKKIFIEKNFNNIKKIIISKKNLNDFRQIRNKIKINNVIEIKKNKINKKIFSNLNIERNIISEFAFISFFIGSIYPGHGAIISNIEINNEVKANNLKEANCKIKLKYFNKSINSSIIIFKGNYDYRIIILFLPKRKKIDQNLNLKKFIKKNEFINSKNLILGGSRGLGAISAKIIAQGSGKIYLTYRDNLKNIKKELNFSKKNKNKINLIKFDIFNEKFSKKFNKINVDNIFYFPTPKIFVHKNNLFNEKIFENFNNFYIYKFYEMCIFFEGKEKKIKIFYPSTTSLTNRPLNLTEYTMSKSASEIMINDLNKSLNYVKILKYRLPRLDTDQTSNTLGIRSLNPIKKMLTVLRNFISNYD